MLAFVGSARLAVRQGGNVAPDSSDVGDASELVAHGTQPLLVAGGEDEIPTASGQPAGEGEAEAA